MKIRLKKFDGNIAYLMRRLGYHPDKKSRKNQLSFSRPLRNGKFPRFHIYYNSKENVLNLHLDQKAPRYHGASDHAAEYDGKLVKQEYDRIKSYVSNN